MIRKHIMPLKPERPDIKWRSHDIHRVESFSDAVFAFAVTLLVISLEVPKTFNELSYNLLSGMMGFFIGFLFVMLIWYDQYLFFRRYGLRDTRTIVWTGALLFVVLFYVYPSKFLVMYLFGGNRALDHGVVVKMVESNEQARQLMILYTFGFTMVYFILWQTYRHAWKMSEHLRLSAYEKYLAAGHSGDKLAMCLVGLLAVGTAYFLPPNLCGIAGYMFFLIYPAIYTYRMLWKRKLKKLFTAEEIKAHHEDLKEPVAY